MVRTKVFVGNLSFKTKEAELADFFGNPENSDGKKLKVISSNIITRGPRSLGYGFVEFDSEEDANAAVKSFDKKELDGRPINVEVAKPNENAGIKNESGGNNGQRQQRPPRDNNRSGQPSSGSGAPRQDRSSGAPRQDRSSGAPRQDRSSGAPRNNAPRQDRTQSDEPRKPSPDTVFVANLPFSYTKDQLADLVKNAGLSFKDVSIATKQKTGRSKGFAFITFDGPESQKKGLDALNNKEVDGRPLSVKIAYVKDEPVVSSSSSTNAPAPVKTSSPAPVKTSSPGPFNAPSTVKSGPSPVKTSSPAPVKSSGGNN